MSDEPYLVISDLTAGYGGPPIIEGVGLEARPGAITAVVGPNGAGKSTLLKTIAGVIRPSRGEIRVCGQVTTGLTADKLVQRGMAYVPQVANVFPSLTVFENLEMGAYTSKSRSAVRARIEELYELFPDLRLAARRPAKTLSGGQRNMLAMARGLMSRPKVLLVDEPTAGMAPTAAVLTQNFKEIDNLAIPIVASDTSAAAEWIKAVTPAVANKTVVSCEGATATSPASTVFMKYFNQDYKGQQPLASATYSYDATIALALAIDKAGTTTGPTYAKDIPLVTSPPGTVVYSYAQGLSDLKAGKKINYDGASGNMDYNAYHNVFGPYELVRSDLTGNEQVVGTISAAQLEAGTPKGA